MSFAFVFPILLLLIVVACVGFGWTEGTWANVIRFLNVVTAGTIATNYFEAVAKLLDGMYGKATYFWDFVALWGIFCIAFSVLRVATNSVSRVKVKFLVLVDRVGSAVFSALTGWMMLCFVMFTLHTAPLAEKFFQGAFDADQAMFFGTGPDRLWLGYIQAITSGAYSRSIDGDESGAYGGGPVAMFDHERMFMRTYAQRRSNVEKLAAGGSFLTDNPPPR